MKIINNCVKLIIMMFLISGCTSTDPNEVLKHDIEIHLQSWYSNTPVEVYLDDSLILSDTVSTGYILAFASIIPMTISEGTHNLRVKANTHVEFEENFEVKSTLYVGVLYDSTQSKVLYIFQNDQFYYD